MYFIFINYYMPLYCDIGYIHNEILPNPSTVMCVYYITDAYISNFLLYESTYVLAMYINVHA